MRDGRYQVTFTSAGGVIADAVWLFAGDRFAGISIVFSYVGSYTQNGMQVELDVHCERHSRGHVKEILHLPDSFDLGCSGVEDDLGFVCRIDLPGRPGIDLKAIGKFLGNEPDERVDVSRRLG